MSSPNDNVIRFAGDYKMRSIRIQSLASENAVDITLQVSDVEIFEDMFSPFMTVNIGVIDTLGLIEKLPMLGEEVVELDIRGPDNETGLIKQTFFIYSISDKIQFSDRGYTYVLQCMSLEALEDINLKLSKSFSGQPSEIFKSLMTTGSLNSQKPLIVEDTKNSVQYISNYWSPAKNIKFLCERAISKVSGAASYVFYETKRNFIFSSTNTLIEQDSSASFFYSVMQADALSTQNKLDVIENMYIDNMFNYIDRLRSGAYGNRLLAIDPQLKIYRYQYYDFLDSFKKHSRLNPNSFSTDTATRRLNATFTTRAAPSGAFVNMHDEKNDEWYSQRITDLAAIGAQTMQIDVPGRFNLYAGCVVDLYIYTGQLPNSSAGSKDLYSYLDTSLSGRWMVTAIKHKLTTERHSMSLQLNKDSMMEAK